MTAVACTFFGHRNCPNTIGPDIYSTLSTLIEVHGVNTFYVGNHGSFDSQVYSQLKALKKVYPHIRYSIVLAYMPNEKSSQENVFDTLLPEGIESVPKRFAISWRNRWMLERSDYVVAYISHSWGGAAQFYELAKKKGKIIINLSSNP